MAGINYSQIKEIINIVIDRYTNPIERDDLDFYDIFFPKICAIYGSDACILISNNTDPTEELKSRKLSMEDIDTIDKIISLAKKTYDEDSSLNLFDIEKTCDPYLLEYANKVLNGINPDDKEAYNHMKEVIKDSFDTNENIYTPISELQKEIENIEKSVK